MPKIGHVPLQQLTSIDIDGIYNDLTIKPATALLLHRVLKGCLETARRKGLIPTNPAADAERPATGELPEKDVVLDETRLAELVEAFRTHPSLFLFVATAAGTGMRRSELLALKWTGIDFATTTITVSQSIEYTKELGCHFTTPKAKRGKRSFRIDVGLLELLRREHDRHKRIVAGIPDGVDVDLSLIKLPPNTLVFPAVGVDLEVIRQPEGVTSSFRLYARAHGFPGVRIHDIRAGHATALLDGGVPIHVVAARCGHDPATLLRWYARRSKKSDNRAAEIIGGILGGVLR